ncbi:ABC transporter permease [uncultured Phycicoccus sp.]|uniref:PhnE/PtxC family ABC transporter permease n=1 Tax=uncultured Phycicoccus sp. TaxID=661422 RepID=UPI00260DE9BA|nr:ABC transporter permease subunit [uncultured Phycicoccus sp.]
MSLDTRPADRPASTRAATERPRVTARRVALRRLVGTGLVALVVGWSLVRSLSTDGALVNTGGLRLLGRLLAAVGDPATSPDFLRIVLDAALTTVVYAALGTAGALVIGVAGALVLSDATWRHPPGRVVGAIRLVLRGMLVGVRAIHELIWALLFVSVLGLDPLVAVLAIAVPFGAQTAKVFAEILDAAPRHPVSAMRASGARSAAALAYGLVPAAIPLLLSYAFYRFECAIRSAVVLGVVGVGGLGQEMVLSLQSRNWDEVWTLVAAVVVLSGVVDVWSSKVRGDLAVVSCSDWSGGSTGTPRGNRSSWARWSAVFAAVGLVAAWFASGVSWAGLVSARTRELTVRLVDDLLPPALPPGGWSVLGGATLDTLAMAVLAMVVAVGVTLVVGPLATRVRPVGTDEGAARLTRAPRLVGRVGARGVLLVLRSVPPTVWAALALLVLFPGVLPGAVALGLYTGGILGRLVAEAWESMDTRPRDALRAAGVRSGLAALVAVLPPSSHQLVTYTLYRFEICVRDTAIVGVVGAAGLGRLFAENLSVFRFSAVTTLLLASFAVSAASEVLGRRIRRAISA